MQSMKQRYLHNEKPDQPELQKTILNTMQQVGKISRLEPGSTDWHGLTLRDTLKYCND